MSGAQKIQKIPITHQHDQLLSTKSQSSVDPKNEKPMSRKNCIFSINSQILVRQIWAKISTLENKSYTWIPPCLKHQGQTTTDPTGIGETFAVYRATISSDNQLHHQLALKQGTTSI